MTTEYQPQHPISQMAYWDTSAAEIQDMKAVYDELSQGDPMLVAKLNRLLEWSGLQRSLDDSYNNTDFSGD